MRAVRRVRWMFYGLLLAVAGTVRGAPAPAPESGPAYLRLESGTWAIGGVDDLASQDTSLVLMPRSCHDHIKVIRLGVGFVAERAFTHLDLAGSLDASQALDLTLYVKNWKTGECDLVRLIKDVVSSFFLQDVPASSALYRDPESFEVEICLEIRGSCGPPPTDKDAVSVQDLTIGPKGGGL